MRFKTLKIAMLFLSLLIMNSANFVYMGTANAKTIRDCQEERKTNNNSGMNEADSYAAYGKCLKEITDAASQKLDLGKGDLLQEIQNTGEAIYARAWTNKCLKEDDNLKITSVIEEPLDIPGMGEQDKEKIRTCVKNTVCYTRENGYLDCISVLSEAGNCAKSEGLFQVTCSEVQVFLGANGTDLLFTYINLIYRWGAGMIGLIAVLVIIISGIQISAAAGEQAAVTSAKNRIFQSILGLVILFFSAIILYSINPTFFTNS